MHPINKYKMFSTFSSIFRYNIYNIQNSPEEEYMYTEVGEFEKIEDKLELYFYENETIQFPTDKVTKSICSDTCPIGFAQVI